MADAEVDLLLAELDAILPDSSGRKDKLLEEIAWDLELDKKEHLQKIEDRKSYNWTRIADNTLNYLSSFSEVIDDWDRASIRDLILYLKASGNEPIPQSLRASLQKSIEKDISKELSIWRQLSQNADKEQAIELLLNRIQDFAVSMKANDKILLFDLLFHLGKGPLSEEANFHQHIMREFIGYEVGAHGEKSSSEAHLQAFLDSGPEYEKSVALAYMLSQPKSNASSIKQMFLPFKSVGKKGGQEAGIWELFSPEQNLELAELKDDPEGAMPKARFMEIVENDLGGRHSAAFNRLRKTKHVLGSASMKTVALQELESGHDAVIAVIDPKAAAQIKNNIAFAKEYLRNLKLQGIESDSGFVTNMIDALERQMLRETNMASEAIQLHRAGEVYERAGQRMREKMLINGEQWTIKVPRPIPGFEKYPNVLVMEQARGITFDKLSSDPRLNPKTIKRIGSWILEATFQGLFRDGFIDANRHMRNVFVDSTTRTIYFFDFGQGMEIDTVDSPWSEDERSHIADFIAALAGKNTDGVVKHALSLANPVELDPGQMSSLKSEITRTFLKVESLKRQIAQISQALANHGVKLKDSASVGAIKGIMTTYAEGYVEPADFSRILKNEIQRALLLKIPGKAKGYMKKALRNCDIFGR